MDPNMYSFTPQLITFFALFLLCVLNRCRAESLIDTPVLCNGPVVKLHPEEFIIHDTKNSSHQLQIATKVELNLDIGHTSCFQVDVEKEAENQNATTENAIKSVFYVFSYNEYAQNYRVSKSFDFGIPEFTTRCNCDCPGSDSFCTSGYDQKFCSRGEICVQKFFAGQQIYGCPKSSSGGSSSLCCEISVRPYQERKFRAVQFTVPYVEINLRIDIYVLYHDKWLPFRSYNKRIEPSAPNLLHLNGDDNVADMNIEGRAGNSIFKLDVWNRYFFYELENDRSTSDFRLLDEPMQTNMNTGRSRSSGYDFLLWDHQNWKIGNGWFRLYETHRPTVTNCKGQKYTDKINTDAPTYVIRNSSGAVNFQPREGRALADLHSIYVKKIDLTDQDDVQNVKVHLKGKAVPRLQLQMFVRQRMNIISHVHVSHFSEFLAEIRLDKFRNRYLNVTLKNAFGQFAITLYKDDRRKRKDVEVSTITKLPFSSNYTDILPLPNHIGSSRHVCIRAYESKKRQMCKRAKFVAEPSDTYTLSQFFIDNEGNCPGCNEAEDAATSFFGFFNPRKWFNGVGTISEGVAIALEVGFYVIIALLVIAIFRRLIWPLIRWAVCVDGPRYQRAICKSDSDV